MSRKTIKLIAGIFGLLVGLLVLLVGGLLVVVWALGNLMCGSDVFQEVYSPNREYKALVYEYNCGATTGFSTQIALLESDATLHNRTKSVFGANGYPDWFNIKLTWEDDTHLVIEHNGKPIPYTAETAYRDISIRYVENREGIVPPRSFMPDELLLPVSAFPPGWTGIERRPLGPEEIKGSHDNNPYTNYDSPSGQSNADLFVSRLDNSDLAREYFQSQRDASLVNFAEPCAPSGSDASPLTSSYTDNFFVGYAEHRYTDGSGGPACTMIGQYDEFIIEFEADIAGDGLTHEQFNDLVRAIDENVTQHLEQDNAP